MMMSSPEPMSLGSPTQSPLPPQSGGSGGVGQFLPQFLLGDMPNPQSQLNARGTNQGGSKYWTGSSNSPPRNPNYHHYSNNIPSNVISGSSLSRSYSQNAYDAKLNNSNFLDKGESNFNNLYSSSHYNQSYQSYSPHQDRTIHSTTILGGSVADPRTINNSQMSSSAKQTAQSSIPGAPPVNRLVDMLNKPTFGLGSGSTNSSAILTPNENRNNKFGQDFYNSENRSIANQQDYSFTPGSNLANPQYRLSPSSPSQIDSSYTYADASKAAEEKMDDTWITVFGFPTSATSYVLQEFSNYGQIIRHFPSNQGNWLHIQYQTKLQAQKALSKNGKVLANSLMVGVMQCIDKKIMTLNTASTNNSLDNTDISFGGNNGPNALSPSSITSARIAKSFSNGSKLDRTQSLRTNVRPLGAFNRNFDQNSATTDSMQPPGVKLPKKNTNVISKAMEYMFGW